MKTWPLIISIVVILAIVCSPALAISKSDLIASYTGGHSPTIPTVVPTTTPTTTPTLTPTPESAWLMVNSTPRRANVFIDGSFRGSTPISIYDLSVGTHQIRVSWWGYEDYSTEVLIPEPSPLHCHVAPLGYEVCEITLPITMDVTLKKIESTLKPTMTIPTPLPTPTPKNYVQPVGSISVISEPAGASVYLDKSFKGFTPITITGISPTCGYESRPGRIQGYTCNIGDYFPHQIELTKIGYQEYTISDVVVTEGKTISVSAKLTPSNSIMSDKQSTVWWETPEWREMTNKYRSVFA
jgi:hypothetical protein